MGKVWGRLFSGKTHLIKKSKYLGLQSISLGPANSKTEREFQVKRAGVKSCVRIIFPAILPLVCQKVYN